MTDARRSPSYGRTGPVTLSHPFSKQSIEGLAILDDQASITMIDPEVVKHLQIPAREITTTTLSTTTIQGTSAPETCRVINNLRIATIDNKAAIDLPSAYVYKSLPDMIREVPSPTDVAKIPGLTHLAQEFPVHSYAFLMRSFPDKLTGSG